MGHRQRGTGKAVGLVGIALLCPFACTLTTPLDSLTSGGSAGDSGTGEEAGDDAAPDLSQAPCREGVGAPSLIAIGGGFCIDATEVTRDQYATWLASNPSTSDQDSWCSWNTDFTPSCAWPVQVDHYNPVGCVDWCDAFAYCKAVGKRLCGGIGGGPSPYGSFSDVSRSQWFRACSSGGVNAYPYGNMYSETTCNGKDLDAGKAVPGGSLVACSSLVQGYQGVYDLSGNVWDWEDSCVESTGDADLCRIRGGAFDRGIEFLGCAADSSLSRSSQFITVGFRCCAD